MCARESVVLCLFVLLTSLQVDAAVLSRSQAVQGMLQRGEISEATAATYQVLAYQRPELLPGELRTLPATQVGCATEHFLRAHQLRMRGGLVWGGPDETGRPVSAGYFDSTTYAVRSHFTAASLQSRAAAILQYTEESLAIQIGNMGFRPPLGDFGEGGSVAFDIYVGNAEGAGGFTAPEAEWPDTPRTDCTTWVMISEEIPDGGDLMSTVAHEINHVLQAAHDCAEWISFWENTATYIMDLTYESVNDYVYFLPHFQMYPHYPLDYWESGNGYQYGAMLLPLTFDEALGHGDGVAVRQIWQASEQVDWENNEPDYFDAIDEVARAYGGTGLDGVQLLLTEWRYVTGNRDDGSHFSEGGDWSAICDDYCEAPDDQVYSLADLPVAATVTNPPYDHGSSYIRVDLNPSITGTLAVGFVGGPTRWGLQVICGGVGPAQVIPLPLSGTNANASIPVSNSWWCVLAVSNLGPASYDPDEDSFTSTSYSFNLDFNLGPIVTDGGGGDGGDRDGGGGDGAPLEDGGGHDGGGSDDGAPLEDGGVVEDGHRGDGDEPGFGDVRRGGIGWTPGYQMYQPNDGCACTSSRGPNGWALMGLFLAFFRRRR